MQSRRYIKIAILLLIVGGIGLFFLFDLQDYLTIKNLKTQHGQLVAFAQQRPLFVAALFFAAYIAVTALSLPGATVMTLAAGAIFGLLTGLLIVSFASAIGATLAFLSSRYLLRDWVKARFSRHVQAIDRGVDRDGAVYLLTLRLLPLLPFFVVNIAMGLTAMRVVPFYLVSQVGMLPGTAVYVNAGSQLARIESGRDVLSLEVVGSLVLLALFPLLARGLIGRFRRRRVYKGFKKPKRFDRNVIVIGAGAGGLVSAYLATSLRAKVTLIEAKEMGGDCLNTGCVPSKALLRSARLAREIKEAQRFGLCAPAVRVNFGEVMARVGRVIRHIAPADSEERYIALGVDVRRGYARLIDPWTVEIDRNERLTARSIVIAAGGEPFVPDIPGLEETGYLTSDTIWDALAKRDTVPERLVIIGGGPIGSEMTQAFARLGSRVTQVEAGDHILSKEDSEVSAFIEESLRSEGAEVLTGHRALRCEAKTLIVEKDGKETRLPFDQLIVAVGRKARLEGYGLRQLGIEADRSIITNDWLETRYPNIYAVGDVAGPYQFTHFAAHQAWYAVVNALFGTFRRFRTDYSVLPWTTFTDPQVAHVGHNEQSAKAADVPYEVVRYELSHLDRAVTDGANQGFVKILVKPGRDRILGATIVAAEAGEILAELVLAMKAGIGLKKILGTIHAYPTLAEANRYAAAQWRQAHKPERLLRWAERYHGWRRG
ncbi:MAG: FAD-dependent oxidoreductase [Sphingomonas sp.]|nr:FAD-dependent oxidoreductase [Sphingomonas sp.]